MKSSKNCIKLLVAILVLIGGGTFFTACEKDDDLYGVSIDDYTMTGDPVRDAEALEYHRKKDDACVADSESGAIPMGSWYKAQLIIGKPNGEYTLLAPNRHFFIRINEPANNLEDGISKSNGVNSITSLDVVTSFGHRQTIPLYACNQQDEYFYLFQRPRTLSTTGYTLNAYSVRLSDLPLAEEFRVLQGFGDADVVAGFTVVSEEPFEPSLLNIMGTSPYLGYLAVQTTCNSNPIYWSHEPVRRSYCSESDISVGDVPINNQVMHRIPRGCNGPTRDRVHVEFFTDGYDCRGRAFDHWFSVVDASSDEELCGWLLPGRVTVNFNGEPLYNYSAHVRFNCTSAFTDQNYEFNFYGDSQLLN